MTDGSIQPADGDGGLGDGALGGSGLGGSGLGDGGLGGSGLGGDGGADDNLSLEMVMAALRADSSDIAIYAKVLTDTLGDSLPADCLSIERDRSMSDRMAKRPGTVTKISVRLGEKNLTLATKRGAPVAEICHEVRGIVLSRNQVSIADWAAELAKGLVAHAEQNARTATALRRLVAGS
jgi:hypothetical protein